MNYKKLMKKIFLIFILIFTVFTLSGTASAERINFEYFSVDVPRGWDAEQKGVTVVITNYELSASLSIAVGPLGEASIEDIAFAFLEQMNGSELEVDEDGIYTFSYTDLSGTESMAFITDGDGKNYLAVAVNGYDEKIEEIIDSVEFYE